MHATRLPRAEGIPAGRLWQPSDSDLRAGNADISSIDFSSATVAVDLTLTIESSARQFLAAGGATLDSLADGIGRCVNDAMEMARSEGKFSTYPIDRGGDIFRLFIQGYCNGHPEQTIRRFCHKDQVLQEPQNITDQCVSEDRTSADRR